MTSKNFSGSILVEVFVLFAVAISQAAAGDFHTLDPSKPIAKRADWYFNSQSTPRRIIFESPTPTTINFCITNTYTSNPISGTVKKTCEGSEETINLGGQGTCTNIQGVSFSINGSSGIENDARGYFEYPNPASWPSPGVGETTSWLYDHKVTPLAISTRVSPAASRVCVHNDRFTVNFYISGQSCAGNGKTLIPITGPGCADFQATNISTNNQHNPDAYPSSGTSTVIEKQSGVTPEVRK